jgi:hypothetical protein
MLSSTELLQTNRCRQVVGPRTRPALSEIGSCPILPEDIVPGDALPLPSWAGCHATMPKAASFNF